MGEGSGNEDGPFGKSTTRRYVSTGAERILYTPYHVDGGEVELIDYMGGDEMVARVATAGHGPRIFPENPSIEEFLPHLALRGIRAPFASTQLKFSIRAPIEAALDIVYAPTANVNEYSGRYSEMLATGEALTPERVASMIGGDIERAKEICAEYDRIRTTTLAGYQALLGMDFARELARSGLGISNDTKFFWKIPLSDLSDLVRQKRRQTELHDTTRPYIEALAEIAEKVAPHAWKALNAAHATGLSLTYPLDREIVDGPLSPAGWSPSETKRVTVPGMEGLLFQEREFLEHSAVQAVDYMGDDSSLAQAARASYGQGTKRLQDDINLVRSLVRDAHTSPIEMAEFAVESRTAVFSDPRQGGRHRTLERHGFMGICPIGERFYLPAPEQVKYQDRVNRQGRGKEMEPHEREAVLATLASTRDAQLAAAHRLEELGAPEGIIRKIKGVGFHTRGWRTGDALNWAKFFALRSDPHAQFEVQEYSRAVERIYQAQLPATYDAVRTYILDGMRLSAREIEFLAGQAKTARERSEAVAGIADILYKLALERNEGIFVGPKDIEQQLQPLKVEDALLSDKRFSTWVDAEDHSKGRKPNREGEGLVKKLGRLGVR